MHPLPFFVVFAASTTSFALSQNVPAACTSVGINPARASQVKASFTSAGVAPTVVPSINPTTDLEATYPDGKAVNLGNNFSIAETVPEPSITFTPESNYDPTTTNYTFLLVDPDAQSPNLPDLRFFLHALYYNVRPSCVAGPVESQPGSAANADAVVLDPYLSLTPLSVAMHRYTLLVYRQPEGTFVPQLQVGEAGRALFQLQEFVDAGGLVLVGGNYFLEGLDTTGDVGS